MNRLLKTILFIFIFSIIVGLFGGGILIPVIIIVGFILYFNSNKKEKEKSEKSSVKKKSVWYKSGWGVAGIILISVIVIALIVGLSESESTNKTTNQSQTNANSYIEPITMTIDKVPVVLSNLYPIRVTIKNTRNKSIYPKFDIIVKDNLGNVVCDSSSLIDDFGTIYSNTTKTGEITIIGCMFNKDGDYNLTVTLIDGSYNKIAETSKTFNVNYWSGFGIDNTTSNLKKIYESELEIKNVPITLANLYPVRLTVNNKGDAFIPTFDYEVTKGTDIVCSGKGILSDIYELDANKEMTFEVIFMGCMFNKDGKYKIKIDLLTPDYNLLDSETTEFEVNYWSQFNITNNLN